MDKITRVSIALSSNVHSEASMNMVKKVRSLLGSSFIVDGTRIITKAGVTGGPARNYDLYQDIGEQLPKWLAVMIVSIFVLLTVMTTSLVLPMKAIFTALLSLCATLGVLVLIFQNGHGADVLDFTATGQIEGLQLIFIFSLAFGLSMDYEVFILTRIQESYEHNPDIRNAVATGIQGSARAVTMAATILAIALAGFVSSRTSILKLIGLGVSLSIVVDATIVRSILVPGSMSLMGRYNWWAPAFLKRLLLKIDIREKSLNDLSAHKSVPL